jgi:hypothetical protein
MSMNNLNNGEWQKPMLFPSNLASMIKGMKNKNQTREDKIKARLQYEKQSVN